MAQLVQFAGGDARLHKGRDVIENFGGEPTGGSHGVDLELVFDGNGHAMIIG